MNIEGFKRIKKEKGINNYEIHKRSGVLESTLSEFERGKHTDLRISTLIKIADALGVTLDELVGRSEGWNLTQGICIAGAWMIENHNESTMVVDMLASMHITKELMQQKRVAEEDYKILSEAIDYNWGRNGK
ncbi:helix-turn-helix transcriptional regulator [uncultured Solobacterium sp.]|uniref:helix-turn-helix domain-containing protein n=2 Tax=Solobacterium TaxID=123375 RepID=UPI001CB288BB|nr:helix-turn-helix transcriptional regulator [uncultured Solobacterium sp.]MBF1092057.1 helix-turn-helix transcriptional regulator [Solobacterium sp.]